MFIEIIFFCPLITYSLQAFVEKSLDVYKVKN